MPHLIDFFELKISDTSLLIDQSIVDSINIYGLKTMKVFFI